MSPKIPGQILGHPGPPLNSVQLRGLLDQLYKLHDRPPMPMSGKREEFDISHTEKATHVYVRVDNPQSLCPKFEGPFPIYSRPSRSQIEVKLGLYKDGRPRLLKFHWSSCKIAHLREGSQVATRPALGRRPAQSGGPDGTDNNVTLELPTETTSQTSLTDSDQLATSSETRSINVNKEPANFQTTESRPVRSSRNPKPDYVFTLTIEQWREAMAG